MKLTSTDDGTTPTVDTYVTPVTPLNQPGAFGVIEPAVTNITPDFIIPTYEYKWNQVVEIQLPDRKKVYPIIKIIIIIRRL